MIEQIHREDFTSTNKKIWKFCLRLLKNSLRVKYSKSRYVMLPSMNFSMEPFFVKHWQLVLDKNGKIFLAQKTRQQNSFIFDSGPSCESFRVFDISQ